MGNIVKLIFQAIAQSSGFTKVNAETQQLQQNLGRVGAAATKLGAAFGNLGGLIGGSLNAILKGNLFELGAIAVQKVFALMAERSERLKKEIEDQKAAFDTLLTSVSDGYSKVVEKLDKEASKRKELLELTHRQTKAELELRRARAIISGDTSTEASMDYQLEQLGGQSAMAKADADVTAAERRVKAAKDALKAVENIWWQSEDKLDQAKTTTEKNKREITLTGAGGLQIGTGKYQYRAEDLAAVKAAEAETAAAKEKVEAAGKAVKTELQGLDKARKAREVARLEQEAAGKKTAAEMFKKERERADAEKKSRDAAVKAAQDSDRKREKQREDDAKAEALAEAEQKRKDEAEQHKRKLDFLKKESDFYRQRLAEALERISAARDVFGNAKAMKQDGKQADELESNRQTSINESRYEDRAKKLQKRIDAAGGDVSKLGRLSNLDRAVWNRMQAERDVQKSGDKVASIDHKMDELIQKITELTSL